MKYPVQGMTLAETLGFSTRLPSIGTGGIFKADAARNVASAIDAIVEKGIL